MYPAQASFQFVHGTPFCALYKPRAHISSFSSFGRAHRSWKSQQIVCSQRKTEDRKAEEVLNKALRQLEKQGNAEGAVIIKKLLKTYGVKQPEVVGDQGSEPTWGVFTPAEYAKGWEVPWGGGRVFGGMLLWAASFVVVGAFVTPIVTVSLPLLGIDVSGVEDKAFIAVINQVAETFASLLVIYLVTRSSEPLPEDLFKVSLKNPFRKNDGWLAWGLFGVIMAPVVVAIAAAILTLLQYEDQVGGKGTVDAVAGIIDLSLPTYLSLLSITSVLAPILEETVFRGFLLTSLTKFVPTPLAVVLSSLVFAAAHLSARDFPQLAALGLILGFSYVRSRNLLTPMMIHGVWNGTVLTLLFLLVSAGVDLNELF